VVLARPETDGPNGPRKEREAHVPRYASVADSPPAAERPTAAAGDTVATPLSCTGSTSHGALVMSDTLHIGPPVTVSVEEAAMLLGIGRTVTYRLVLGGELRSVKIGRRRLVVRASVQEYVARLERSA
jgi:excisionase family DNA binding protein